MFMAREFEDLPFDTRPDLTPYIIHLTKNTKTKNGHTAFDNLVGILKRGEIMGSTTKSGFIKGPTPAACFMDVPFSALKYVLTAENTKPNKPRYEPYGVFVTKKWAYAHGCRPVLYLSNKERESLGVPDNELWRVVNFEVKEAAWISWLHEREWRCPGSFQLPVDPFGVLVRTARDAKRLNDLIKKKSRDFKIKPLSIIPLTVICQGLLK